MTSKVPAMIVTPSSITITINGLTRNITSGHSNYERIRQAAKDKNFDLIEHLADIPRSVNSVLGKGRVTINDGVVYYDGEVMNGALSKRIIYMIGDGFDAAPMIAFMENLMSNPAKSAVDELYEFLEKNDLPITDDGHFLAYKKVRNDYLDIYTGKFRNKPGDVVSMPRNKVDDNRNNECSQGLHFASLSYLPHYSSTSNYRVVIVKINPADVVSIPRDYNYAKGRTWKYEVVDEHDSQTVEKFSKAVYTVHGNGKAIGVAPAAPSTDVAGLYGKTKDDPFSKDFGTKNAAAREPNLVVGRSYSADELLREGVKISDSRLRKLAGYEGMASRYQWLNGTSTPKPVPYAPGATPPAKDWSKKMTPAEAALALGITATAVVKRAHRGSTVRWSKGDPNRVKVLNTELKNNGGYATQPKAATLAAKVVVAPKAAPKPAVPSKWSAPLSVSDAANALGITESAVKKRADRSATVRWDGGNYRVAVLNTELVKVQPTSVAAVKPATPVASGNTAKCSPGINGGFVRDRNGKFNRR